MVLLTRIGRLHEAFLHEQCARHDLTSADFRVLSMLRLYGEDRLASPTLISSWIVQTSGGLTATLRRLAERGFIERSADPGDGRGRLVAITPEGLTALNALFGDVLARFEQISDLVDLGTAVPTLTSVLSAYEQVSGQRHSASLIPSTDFAPLIAHANNAT